MKKILQKRFVSIVLAGVFSIISVTGILMFFKVESMKINMLHSWIGIGFVIVGIYHIVKNINFLKNYLRYISSSLILLFIISMSLLFVNPYEKPLISPKKEIMTALFTQPISIVGSFLKKDMGEVILIMQSHGLTIKDTNQTLTQIALANDKGLREIFFMFFEKYKEKNSEKQ